MFNNNFQSLVSKSFLNYLCITKLNFISHINHNETTSGMLKHYILHFHMKNEKKKLLEVAYRTLQNLNMSQDFSIILYTFIGKLYQKYIFLLYNPYYYIKNMMQVFYM